MGQAESPLQGEHQEGEIPFATGRQIPGTRILTKGMCGGLRHRIRHPEVVGLLMEEVVLEEMVLEAVVVVPETHSEERDNLLVGLPMESSVSSLLPSLVWPICRSVI